MDPNLLNMTLLSSLRTGNILFDLLVAMMIPALFAGLWQHIGQYWGRLLHYFALRNDTFLYERIIKLTLASPMHYDEEHDNLILQRAVKSYIGTQLKPIYIAGKYSLHEMKVSSENSDYDSEYDDEEKDPNPQRKVKKLLELPQIDEGAPPIEIEPGVWFMERHSEQELEQDDRNDKKKQKQSSSLEYAISSNGHKGQSAKQVVDGFLQRALDWYIDEIEKLEDNSRWMYQPLVANKFANTKQRFYKRYQLSSDKTFKSLFFPQKSRVLHLLEQFENHTGKFAVKGFPHKLGILLHGPPGTGKTSLVKAIAARTKRHIVSVSLSRIETNQELLDVMCDAQLKYITGDKDDPTKDVTLTHDQCVFLLEDVDAATHVAHKREDASHGGTFTGMKSTTEQLSRAYSSETRNSSDDEEDEDVEQDSGYCDDEATDADGPPPQYSSEDKRNQKAEEKRQKKDKSRHKDKNTSSHQQGEVVTQGINQMTEMLSVMIQQQQEAARLQAQRTQANDTADYTMISSLIDGRDKLSLDGLLTVLDGVIDTPGRILVMTTNHPELIDPAVLRPGRINLQLYMGNLRLAEMREMVKHYYPEASEPEIGSVVNSFSDIASKDKAAASVNGVCISPAEFEQVCAESLTIEDLRQRLSSLQSD